MRTLQVVSHQSDAELKAKLAASRGTGEHSRWQIIYLIQVAGQHSAAIIAPLGGLSLSSVYKIVEAYNKAGTGSIVYKLRGGRRNALLSVEQEAALFSSIEQKASRGLLKTANDIRGVVEAKVGKVVSDDYLWDLLNRNGWKKKVPRPHHPKRDVTAQSDFKKNSLKSWMP
jgi:transposase